MLASVPTRTDIRESVDSEETYRALLSSWVRRLRFNAVLVAQPELYFRARDDRGVLARRGAVKEPGRNDGSRFLRRHVVLRVDGPRCAPSSYFSRLKEGDSGLRPPLGEGRLVLLTVDQLLPVGALPTPPGCSAPSRARSRTHAACRRRKRACSAARLFWPRATSSHCLAEPYHRRRRPTTIEVSTALS